MYRKHRANKLNGDGPPKYKPPPPKKKNNNTANRPVYTNPDPVSDSTPLQSHNYSTQSPPEPVTDLDAFNEDEEVNGPENGREHYYSAAPSGWDDPANSEVPPPYMQTNPGPRDHNSGSSLNHGDSFVSSAMFV